MALKRLLIVSDTHAPFHDPAHWKLMMKVARDFEPQIIVHMGDLLDCYSLSRFDKDPQRLMAFADEVAEGRALLRALERLTTAERLIFCEGNHEDRYQRYINDKAPALAGLFAPLPKLLEMDDWEWVPYRDDIKIGKVYYTHDVGFVGRYSIYRNLDAYQHTNVTGHTHRFAYLVEGNAAGEHKLAASFGWLGDVEQIDYRHRARCRRDWVPGFGLGYLDERSGHTYFVPVPIVEGRCMVEGKVYR